VSTGFEIDTKKPEPRRGFQQSNELFEGTHFHLGGSLTGGFNVIGGFGASAQAGVFFGRSQLVFDLGVHVGYSLVFHGSGVFGYLVPLYQQSDVTVAWTFRGGVSFAAYNSLVIGPRLDLIGIGIRTGNLYIDFQLPTFSIMFGTPATAQLLARASIAYVF
jgi:hypothetical protein